jgi:hypothetical protein
MKKNILVLLIVIITCLLGCQPTPVNAVLNSKVNLASKIEESITSVSFNSSDFPLLWQETYNEGSRFSVNINANVVIPQIEQLPVYKVEPDFFTLDQLNKMIKYFIGNNALYLSRDMNDISNYTKTEIENLIIELKQKISDPNSDLNLAKSTDPENYQIALESINNRIKLLEEAYDDAPTVLQEIPVELDERIEQNNLDAYVYLNKSNPALIHIEATHTSNNKNNRFVYSNWGTMGKDNIYEELDGGTRFPPTISIDDAREMAETAVENLAGTDMSLQKIAIATYRDFEDIENWTTYLESPQYYVFYFTRDFGGISTTYQDLLGVGDSIQIENYKQLAELYFEPYPYEYIKVSIDDTGIIEFDWRSPYKVSDIIANNVSILDFETIKQIFKKYIFYIGAWSDEGNDSIGRKVSIDNITLGLMRIINPNKTDEYLIVPVWDFFGSYADIYPEGYSDNKQFKLNENNEKVYDKFAHSLLTINAIDGSIIDRGLGY